MKRSLVFLFILLLAMVVACSGSPAPQEAESTAVSQTEEDNEAEPTEVAEEDNEPEPTAVVEEDNEAEPTAETEEDNESASAEETVTLKVMDSFTDPAMSDGMDKLNALFMEQNPNVTIDREAVPVDDMRTIVQTTLSGNDAPDVIYYDTGPGFAGVLADANLIRPIDDLYAQYEWDSRIFPWTKARTTFGGETYGIGNELEFYGAFYNQGLFDQLGVEVPETLDDLLNICQVAQENGVYAIAFGDQPKWPAYHMFSIAANNVAGRETLENILFGDGSWDDPDIIAAIDLWFVQLNEAGCFPPDPAAISYEDGATLFYTEQALMHFTGTWWMSEVLANSDFDVKWLFFPAVGDNPVLPPAGLGSGFFVSENTAEIDTAGQYLDFLFSEDAAQIWMEESNIVLPINIDTSQYDLPDLLKFAVEALAGQEMGYNIDVLTPDNFNTMMGDGFQAVLLGEKTPAEQAADLQAEWVEAGDEGRIEEGESGESETTAAPAVISEPTTLKVMDSFTDASMTDAIDKLNAKFMEMQPNVTIDREAVPVDDMRTVVQTTLSGNEAPDVIYYDTGPGFAGVLANANLIRPIDDLYAQYDWDSRIFPWTKERSSFGGETYGIGNELEFYGAYYNMGLFDQLGVEVPETLDDLLNICQVAQENGVYAIAFGDQPKWPAYHMFSIAANNVAGREALEGVLFGDGSWDDPAMIAAIDLWFVQLEEAGCFPPDPAAISYEDGATLFYNEQAMMHFTGTWWMSEVLANTSFDVGWLFFPSVDGNPSLPPAGLGSGYFVSSASENVDAAGLYLDFLFSEAAAQIWMEEANVVLPINVDTSQFDLPPLLQFAVEALAGQEMGYNIDVLTPDNFNTMMGDGFQAVLLGEKTPAEQAADLQAEWEEAIADGKVER